MKRQRTEDQLEMAASILTRFSAMQDRDPQKRLFDKKDHLNINHNWLRNEKTGELDWFGRGAPLGCVKYYAPINEPESPPISGIDSLIGRKVVCPSVSLNKDGQSRKRKRYSDEFDTTEEEDRQMPRKRRKITAIRF